MKGIDKEFIGVGLEAQIGKSSIGMISSLDGRYWIELAGLDSIGLTGSDRIGWIIGLDRLVCGWTGLD